MRLEKLMGRTWLILKTLSGSVLIEAMLIARSISIFPFCYYRIPLWEKGS